MQILKTRSGWLAVGVALVGAVTVPRLGAERFDAQAALPATTVVNPALFEGLQFRSLESAFSRGGRSTAVAGVTSSEQVYYMGTTGGGVWKTDNAGTTWRNVSDGFFEAGSIGSVAVAESNPSVIYVGTGSACPRGNISSGIGMYKSADAGATWSHVGLRNAGQIGRVLVHPTNPDIAYAAALGNLFGPNRERGVYRTRDGGRNWELVKFVSDRTGAVDISMNPKNPDVLIAAMWTVIRQPWTIESGSTEGGLFRSTDGGTTWTKLTQGLPTKVMVGKVGVSISPADPNRVYAQVEAAEDQGGVFVSNDGGTSWTRTFTGRALQQRAWYYTHIIADPVDVDTVYGLNVGAMKSTDGGKTFGSAGIQAHGDHHDLWINPKNNKAMIGANDGGAAITLNATAWSTQNNQPTSEIYRVTTDRTRVPFWVYGAQQDNSTVAVPSQGTEATYAVGGGESGHIAVDPRDHNVFYAGNYGGSISRTDRTRGTSEDVRVYADSQTGQRAADMKYRFQWNAPILISPHTPDVVYTTSQVVHRTTNGGQDWTVISPDLTRNDKVKQGYSGGEGVTRDNTGVEVYSTIFAFEESPIAPGHLWAGSDDGLVHLSRDNGKTWNNITPSGMPEGTVNAIALSRHDAGRAYLALHRYRMGDQTPFLYRTTDFGRTWTRIANGANGIPNWHFTRVVREDPVKRGLLYAGTEFGLYVSFDDGANWQPFQLNLPRTPVSDLKVHNDTLVISTQGRGFWLMDDLSVVRSLAPGGQASAPMLFKPSDGYRATGMPPTFHYYLPQAPTEPVGVEVTDSTGKVVYTTTAQPGAAVPPMNLGGGFGGGRGFGPGGGGGGGRGAAAPAGRGGGGAGMVEPPAGGRGRGGPGGAAPGGPSGPASAVRGLNRAIWMPNAMRLAPPFTVMQGAVMWGGGGGQGPKVATGPYTVKVTNGAWSATQTFNLKNDPRYAPMTAAEGKQQMDMALEIGGMIKTLYESVLSIRDVKKQLAAHVEKAGATSPVAAAAKTLADRLTAAEADLTQVQGEGGQDALNYPGRMDNQLIVLYGGIVGPERRLGTPVLDRYADIKPEATAMLARAAAALKTDVAAYNAVATKAGMAAVVVK